MPIMPTPKPNWVWVIRRYNFETGKHEILPPVLDHKEEAQKEIDRLRKYDSLKGRPYNYVYEKIERGRPDLHHEKLMEEDRYPKLKEWYK